MESASKQNAALQKQLQDMSKSQKESLDKLTEQNKSTNALLERERQKSSTLERELASKGNNLGVILIVAIIALLVGIFIAKLA